jgi:hypothetical protein
MTPSNTSQAVHHRGRSTLLLEASSATGTATNPLLADCRQMPADGGRMTGFDQWSGAEVDIGGACKRAHSGNHSRADQSDSHNF